MLLLLLLHLSIEAFVYFKSWDLVPPESILVEGGKAVDHDGDRQGEDEDAGEGAETTNDFACQRNSF